MIVLILGGTGAMGRHLVRLLDDGNNKVYVTSRQIKSSTENVCYLRGNAHDMGFLTEILGISDWDVIVDFMMYDISEFVVRKDLLLKSCKQYVSISSSRVYADCDIITEESPRLIDTVFDEQFIKAQDYSMNKALMENELFKSERNNFTIIRPYITYSENRLQLGALEKEDWLYRVLKGRSLVVSEDILEKETTLTYGYDVARVISSLLGRNETLGQVYNPTQKESMTWGDILSLYLEVISKETGIKPKLRVIKNDPALKSIQGKWQILYDRLYNRVFDNSKLKNYIDISSFVSPSEGLVSCLTEFLKHPTFQPISPGGTALIDRACNEWSSYSYFGSMGTYVKYLLRRTTLKN